MSWQKQWEGGRVYSGSQFKATVHHGGEVLAEEHEMAAHITPMIRKQRMMNVFTLSFVYVI